MFRPGRPRSSGRACRARCPVDPGSMGYRLTAVRNRIEPTRAGSTVFVGTGDEQFPSLPLTPVQHDALPPDEGPREECGVFGVWAPGEEVAKLTYFGLYALQHRGQEAAGIAVADGAAIVVFKD